MAQLGFIGIGNMGYAMLKGSVRIVEKADILFTDVNMDKVKQVYNETGIRFAESNAECVNAVKYVVLAVKPQFYGEMLKSIENVLTPEHVVISIAPGITIEALKRELGRDRRIVRAMPNTPALIGEGMAGICYEDGELTEEEIGYVSKLFSALGKVEVVPEKMMDAVVCASGSSPAYVYMFIEAMADACVKYGMPRDKAYQFVAQTVSGAAKMVLESGKHPGELKDMVCSPGGTTIAGVAALEEFGFRNSVIKAVDACYKKATEIK